MEKRRKDANHGIEKNNKQCKGSQLDEKHTPSQHNAEQESQLDLLLYQYQERAVRNKLRQMIGQFSRLTNTHFNTYLNFYSFILLMCTLASDLISE